MAKAQARHRAVFSPEAERDIRSILRWSEGEFGKDAAKRYRSLLIAALRDIEANPMRAGSQDREELAPNIRVYHLRFSTERIGSNIGVVRNPRHFVVYRIREEKILDVVRVLHDARDLQRPLSSLGE